MGLINNQYHLVVVFILKAHAQTQTIDLLWSNGPRNIQLVAQLNSLFTWEPSEDFPHTNILAVNNSLSKWEGWAIFFYFWCISHSQIWTYDSPTGEQREALAWERIYRSYESMLSLNKQQYATIIPWTQVK